MDEISTGFENFIPQSAITRHPRVNPSRASGKLKTNRERGGIHGARGRSCNCSPAGTKPTYSTARRLLQSHRGNQAKDSHLKSRARTQVLKEWFTQKWHLIQTRVTLSSTFEVIFCLKNVLALSFYHQKNMTVLAYPISNVPSNFFLAE